MMTMRSTITGLVSRTKVAEDSKSEREAVVLTTDSQQYVLRIEGNNPFTDPALDLLVGKKIKGCGIVHGYTFILESWSIEVVE